MIVKQPDQKFPTAPEGTHPAVCVDEIDLGKVTSIYNGEERLRHMVRLVWQIDEQITDVEARQFQMEPGSRYVVKQDYTASLDEKAKLRKHLQSWRGRAFTPEELMGFDLESVVGASCMVSVVHNAGRKGGVFANVEGVMKTVKGMGKLEPMGYVRVKDRKAPTPGPATGLTSAPRNYHPAPEELPPSTADYITDDDVPF